MPQRPLLANIDNSPPHLTVLCDEQVVCPWRSSSKVPKATRPSCDCCSPIREPLVSSEAKKIFRTCAEACPALHDVLLFTNRGFQKPVHSKSYKCGSSAKKINQSWRRRTFNDKLVSSQKVTHFESRPLFLGKPCFFIILFFLWLLFRGLLRFSSCVKSLILKWTLLVLVKSAISHIYIDIASIKTLAVLPFRGN